MTQHLNENLSPLEEKDDKDPALRPQYLDQFIGQKELRSNLSVFIGASKLRKTAMDHVLLHGPPGLGKTTLAQIISRELGVNYHMTSGPVIAKAGDLAAILTNLEKKDVLFIDEIHRLSPSIEEVLYPAMEDYSLDLVIGEGPAARSIRIDLQPFTLVGATTRLGLLTTPLRDRFGIPLRLEFYSINNLVKVITRGASLIGINIDDNAAIEIAKRSRGTPRIANRLLRRVFDFALINKSKNISLEIASISLTKLGVDKMGLDSSDIRYLKLLAHKYGGGPVGLETIAAGLSESKDAVEEVIEPYLLQEGFIQRSPRGRILGDEGWSHLGISKPIERKTKDLFKNHE